MALVRRSCATGRLRPVISRILTILSSACVRIGALDLQQLVTGRGGVAAAPTSAAAIRASMPSAMMRSASSTSASTISASGTTRTTWPFTNRWPLPRPPAMPRSASRASPGPFTTHPITATCSGMLRDSSAACAAAATPITSTSARPHDGHAIRSRPLRSRSPSDSSKTRPAFASSTGSAVSEKRIVSPIPSASSVRDAGHRLDQALRHRTGLGDAEVQRMIGRLRQQPVRVDHQRHVRRLHRDLHVVEVDFAEEVELVHRRRDERLRCDAAVRLRHRRIERTGVDADADRQAAVLRLAPRRA